MPGETTLGGGGRRTKVMDGSWNPRRVNCWPLHVRLGDTLALPRLRKSMHPFVHSLSTPSASRPPPSASPTPYQRHRRRGQPLLYMLCLVLFLATATATAAPLPRLGEGWVRGCRRRPATALCISHRAATNFHSLPFAHSFFSLLPVFPSSTILRSFSMPIILPRFSFYRERESSSPLKSFSSSRELTFLLITHRALMSVERTVRN